MEQLELVPQERVQLELVEELVQLEFEQLEVEVFVRQAQQVRLPQQSLR
jgi:hypothetical protein